MCGGYSKLRLSKESHTLTTCSKRTGFPVEMEDAHLSAAHPAERSASRCPGSCVTANHSKSHETGRNRYMALEVHRADRVGDRRKEATSIRDLELQRRWPSDTLEIPLGEYMIISA